MKHNIERKILDTLNGSLNKQLIDNFKVTRRSDGSELSDAEIMQLTCPYFKAAQCSYNPAECNDDEPHWSETPVQKQFGETIKMAAESSDVGEAARMSVGTIYPMCSAISEHSGEEGVSLYNIDQMIVSFLAGHQWLQDRINRKIPLEITAEGAMDILKEFLNSIPKGWTIEQAIEHLKNQ